MIGGQLLEYFNSRLYAALDDKIFFSSARGLTYMDTRKNFHQHGWGTIHMMKGLQAGMYVGTGKGVYFLPGRDALEFHPIRVTDTPPIPGTAVKVEGEDISDEMTGTVLFWLSEEGPFLGLPSGQVKQVTGGNWVPDDGVSKGTAIARDDLGFFQYVCSYEFKSGYGGARGEIVFPAIMASGHAS
jgi:hypothetical protein